MTISDIHVIDMKSKTGVVEITTNDLILVLYNQNDDGLLGFAPC